MEKKLHFRSMMILSILFLGVTAKADIPAAITLTPLNSNGKVPITITFDPAKACDNGVKTLVGETKIQMHSSAHTPYFPLANGWGNYSVTFDADPADTTHTTTDLTSNGDGTWSITFTPADFYAVPADSAIIGLSVVFNNGSWDKEGKDSLGSACSDFKVSLTNDITNVKTVLLKNSFAFSPNPVGNQLLVTSSDNIQSIIISDILGKQVLKISGTQSTNFKLSTEGLSRGIYIISVYDSKGFAGSSKLVKQ